MEDAPAEIPVSTRVRGRRAGSGGTAPGGPDRRRRCLGVVERLLHLELDLALADDHRVEPACDREQVRGGALVVVVVGVVDEVLGSHPAHSAKKLRRSATPPW
jgi:hypothetical protein